TLIGYYCLKWIFGYYCINPSCILLSESVNGTNAGRTSLAEDKGPDVPAAVPADASSSKDKAPEPSLVLLDKNQPTTLIGYYCLKWIFGYYCINPSCILLSESVNGTNAGRTSLAEDKGPDVPAAVPADASSSKDKAPEPSLVLLDKNQPT
ncbi:hypothetical protein HID58_080443, partial [Brassica napus]